MEQQQQQHIENIFEDARHIFINRTILSSAQVSIEYEAPSFDDFYRDTYNIICEIITTKRIKNNRNQNLKICFVMGIKVKKINTNEQSEYPVSSKYQILFTEDDLETFIRDLFDKLNIEYEMREIRGSGWTFLHTKFLTISMIEYSPITGASYIELPEWIKNKKAVINVKNNDQECFKWAILSAKYKQNKDPQRVSKYKNYKNELNFKGITFPVTINQIDKFENQNDLIINVYHEVMTIEPLKISKKLKTIEDKVINLLLIRDDENSHYCWIKDFSRLVRSQTTTHTEKLYYCYSCLSHYDSKVKLSNHLQDCLNHDAKKLILPEQSNNICKFKNPERTQKVPYTIYADFECFPNNPNVKITLGSSIQSNHEANSYSYVVIRNNKIYDFKLYREPDADKKFIDSLIETCKKLKQIPEVPIQMTQNDWNDYNNTTECNYCKKKFNNDKVKDHDHFTGEYRQALCKNCNINKFRKSNFIPVYFHNAKGYDSHLIISAITNQCSISDIKIIPNNSEKYISTSIYHKDDEEKFEIRFLDTFAFMSSSLDKLASNLPEKKYLNQYFKTNFNNEQIELISKKGIYPYEYIDSFEKFKEASLPQIEKFYSSLNNSSVSENDYKHAQNVWNKFSCRNLGDYHDLYLKTDVFLLADIFENFRNVCYKHYGLDPCWYYTAPGLAWDAMLKSTSVELELITDPDMYLFIEKGIRGGIVQSVKKYAKANNKYLPKYDTSKPSNYIMYLDANNLYGWAMMQPLPYRDFKWDKTFESLQDQKFKDEIVLKYIKDLNSNGKGCFLEVDLEYSKELHNLHNDFPFCPETMKIGKVTKLACTLFDKEKYVLHYKSLEQVLKHRLKIKKIHRILTFDESPWLKPYIELNTNLRTKAKNEFEKDFFKLMNNSVFGKTMENVRNRCDVKLVNNNTKLTKLTAKPTFKYEKKINPYLSVVEMLRTNVKLDKPIYVGATILDISKTLMYEFHYNIMKKRYGNRVVLLYQDTDSLIYLIFTDDIYEDFKEMQDLLDTSDYPKDHFLYSEKNKKVVGKMKDEMNGSIISEFVSLQPKVYSYSYIENGENKENKKAKGVKKSVIKDLKFETYKDVLFNQKEIYKTQYLICSKSHKISTIKQEKKALSYKDDKRFILDDKITTLAYGHFRIQDLTKTNSSS